MSGITWLRSHCRGLFQNLNESEAFEFADRADFHDFNRVTRVGLLGIIVNMDDRFALDFFFVERVRALVKVGNLDALGTAAADHFTDDSPALFALGRVAHGNKSWDDWIGLKKSR